MNIQKCLFGVFVAGSILLSVVPVFAMEPGNHASTGKIQSTGGSNGGGQTGVTGQPSTPGGSKGPQIQTVIQRPAGGNAGGGEEMNAANTVMDNNGGDNNGGGGNNGGGSGGGGGENPNGPNKTPVLTRTAPMINAVEMPGQSPTLTAPQRVVTPH